MYHVYDELPESSNRTLKLVADFMCKGLVGELVPIPTRPAESMRIRSTLLVPKAKMPVDGVSSVTPDVRFMFKSADETLVNWATLPPLALLILSPPALTAPLKVAAPVPSRRKASTAVADPEEDVPKVKAVAVPAVLVAIARMLTFAPVPLLELSLA